MTDPESAPQSEPFRLASLGRHSLTYGVGVVLTKAVGFLMLPIYMRWLSVADYGVLQLIVMTFEVVTIVAGSRIGIGIFHFYHKEETERGRNRALSTAFFLLTTTYGLAAIGTVLVSSWIAGIVFGEAGPYASFVEVAAVSMALEGMSMVPMARLQLENRSTLFVLVGFARLVLQVILNLVFLIVFDMGVLGVLLSTTIAHASVGLPLIAHLLRDVGRAFAWESVRAYVRFGAPLMVMQGATFIATFGDRYFLNRAAGEGAVGLYSLAYQFGFLVSAFGWVPFNQIWDPQRFAIAKREDRDEIYAKVFVYLNLLLITMALGVALFAGDVLRIIGTADFQGATVYIPVLAAAYIFPCWSGHLNLGTYITERTEYYTVAKWIAAFVALAGYVTLIPRWHAWGATVTTFVSLAVDALLVHLFSQHLWRVRYRWRPIVLLAGAAVAVGTASVFMPTMPILVSIGAHLGLLTVYAVLVWLLPVLTADERRLVLRTLSSLLPRRERTA